MNQLPAERSDGPSAGPPLNIQQTTIVQAVEKPKSVGLAVLLAFLFGPLGMLYSTILGAAVMFAFALIVAVPTMGAGLLVVVPGCMIWAGIAASDHNKDLAHSPGNVQTYSSVHDPRAQYAQSLPPAGWFTDPGGSGQLRYWSGAQWTTHFASDPRAEEGKTDPPQLGA